MNQVLVSNIILLIILILSIAGRNNALSIATTFLLLVNLLGQLGGEFQTITSAFLQKADSYGLELGVIILLIGVMSPIALGNINLKDVVEIAKTKEGIVGVISGLLVAIFAAKGGQFLHNEPKMIFTLVIGTIMGIVLFKGYPVGPLVGSGIAVIIIKVIDYFN